MSRHHPRPCGGEHLGDTDPDRRCARRHSVAAVARKAGAAVAGIWLEAPPATLEARVAGRTGDASDATVTVVRQQAQGVMAPAADEAGWRVIDGTGEPDTVAERARAALNDS